MDEEYEKTNAQEWRTNTPRRLKKANPPPDSSKKPAYVQRPPMEPQQTPSTARRNDKRNLRSAKSAWLVAEGVKQRQTTRQEQQQQQQQVLLVDLGDDVEHSAEAAWRRHEPPLASISVPDELVWRDQQHEVIARKFGTFVTSQDRFGTAGAITLHMWGEPDAVKHTRQAIHDWVQRESPSKQVLGKCTFSKTRSFLPTQRRNEERRWAREVKRQRFRQFPPLGTVFGAIGTFYWPMQEYQPHEVLGSNYEALDPIRMECSCYVVFQKSIPGFEVMGGIDDVKNALIRLRKACFQIAARQIAPVRKYFLLFDDVNGEIPSAVVLQGFEPLKVIATNGSTVQQPPAKSPRSGNDNENGPIEQEVRTKSIRDVKISGRSIMLMLAKLHYYRGHIKFRIRLGTFLATHYMSAEDDTYAIDDFQEMLKQSPFRGEVTHEIGKKHSEDTALKTLQSANDVLFPCDSTVRSLIEVKPIYTAIFVLADSAGDMRLDISWYEMMDGKKTTLEPLSRRWTRLDRDTTSATSLLDISLINLNRGCAWQFDILAAQVVEANRMKPEFEHFADGVRINSEIALKQRTDQPFVRWSPYARVKKMQQRVSYQFGLGNSDYTLELSRFQDRVFTHKSAMPGDVKSQTYEPRWSLEVWHSEWDKLLTMNEHLNVGAMADWEDGVKIWFPEDDVPGEFGQVKGEKGFEQLISKLTMIEELVLKPDSEMFGGMDIG